MKEVVIACHIRKREDYFLEILKNDGEPVPITRQDGCFSYLVAANSSVIDFPAP